jgi:hypothetical protein
VWEFCLFILAYRIWGAYERYPWLHGNKCMIKGNFREADILFQHFYIHYLFGENPFVKEGIYNPITHVAEVQKFSDF